VHTGRVDTRRPGEIKDNDFRFENKGHRTREVEIENYIVHRCPLICFDTNQFYHTKDITDEWYIVKILFFDGIRIASTWTNTTTFDYF
jgi:hypothetical protein